MISKRRILHLTINRYFLTTLNGGRQEELFGHLNTEAKKQELLFVQILYCPVSIQRIQFFTYYKFLYTRLKYMRLTKIISAMIKPFFDIWNHIQHHMLIFQYMKRLMLKMSQTLESL